MGEVFQIVAERLELSEQTVKDIYHHGVVDEILRLVQFTDTTTISIPKLGKLYFRTYALEKNLNRKPTSKVDAKRIGFFSKKLEKIKNHFDKFMEYYKWKGKSLPLYYHLSKSRLYLAKFTDKLPNHEIFSIQNKTKK